MTASFLGTSLATTQSPVASHRRHSVVASAAKGAEMEKSKVKFEANKESSNGRRELMFAAAAAVICSVSGIAMAEEPKAGTAEAKKFYAPVCVTMPTARICRK